MHIPHEERGGGREEGKERESKPASGWIEGEQSRTDYVQELTQRGRPWPTAVSEHVAPPCGTHTTCVVPCEEPCHGAKPCGVGENGGGRRAATR